MINLFIIVIITMMIIFISLFIVISRKSIRAFFVRAMIGIINEAIELDNDFSDGEQQFYHMISRRCNKIWANNFNENIEEMKVVGRNIVNNAFKSQLDEFKGEVNQITSQLEEFQKKIESEEYLDEIITRIKRKQLK